MTEYSAEVLSLLADWRESIEKEKARISDETEAERTGRMNHQHRLQAEILATVRKDAWETAGKVLAGRAPYRVALLPEVRIMVRGPMLESENLDDGTPVEPGDYVVQFLHPETSPFTLVMDEQQFLELFMRWSGEP